MEILDAIETAAIIKGGKRAQVGETRTFGGRQYIKTATGWQFHGKGTGQKAKEHVENAKKHNEEKGSNEQSKKQETKAIVKTSDVASTAKGDLTFNSEETAHRISEKQFKNEIKGGSAVVKMPDGKFVVTTNARAKQFIKEHGAKLRKPKSSEETKSNDRKVKDAVKIARKVDKN